MARRTIPILICFDVEPDPRAVPRGRPEDWVGFERLAEFAHERRSNLSEATGGPVHYIWSLRMDPQIASTYGSPGWAADRYRAELADLASAGDEIGLHIHPWRWEDSTGWTADFVDADWGRTCVEMSFAAFERAFGRECTTVRFGDRWLTADNLQTAVSLGARFDLTPEPGKRPEPPPEPAIGLMPDYAATPHHPYRPSSDDPTRDGGGDDAPWTFPVTTHPHEGFGQPYSYRTAIVDTAPPRGDGPFRGWVDVVDCDAIAGWAWDESAPDDPVDVAVFDRRRCIAVITASRFRGDLVDAGIGDGHHSFYLRVGESLRDGRAHTITARIVGTDHQLGGGPRVLRCDPRPAPDDLYPLNLYYDSAIICQSLDALIEAGERTHLAMVVRSDIMVSDEERPQLMATFDELPALARRARGRFVTPAEALDLLPKPSRLGRMRRG